MKKESLFVCSINSRIELNTTVDAANEQGFFFQFGYSNVTTAYNPSGVYYDNVIIDGGVAPEPTPAPSVNFCPENTPLIHDGYELVWQDNFEGNVLDTDTWSYMYGDGSQYGIPGWGNNEEQLFFIITPSWNSILRTIAIHV